MKQPNMIVIMTDDQGYGDLSCMGNTEFETPHLDNLAESGVRFTSWYANSPVCSPSRASMLTGRYPGNAGVRSILGGTRRKSSGLPRSVPTIGRILGESGYRTGLSGKWHLGTADGSRPTDHGFDESFGFMAGCIDYYSHIYYWGMPDYDPVHDLWLNEQEVWRDGQYMTDMITNHAVDFIKRSSTDESPFFLFVSYNAPHYPMHAPQHYIDRFPHLSPDRQIMAAMLSAVDDGVGTIQNTLRNQGRLDDTIIIFMSDNGPSRETRNWLDGTVDPYYGGSAGGLKGHKYSLYEGGIRVPGIMSWGSRISGGQVIDSPCAAIDILPTLLSACDISPEGYELDGINLLPMLTANSPLPERDLFWEMNGQLAVRRGDWKLVLNGKLVENGDIPIPVHLANLSKDMSEQTNLADTEQQLLSDMKTSVEQWYVGIKSRWESERSPKIDELVDPD